MSCADYNFSSVVIVVVIYLFIIICFFFSSPVSRPEHAGKEPNSEPPAARLRTLPGFCCVMFIRMFFAFGTCSDLRHRHVWYSG